ncbi:MAG: segregation and condensation protein A [Candidatus Puniceispirillales bacterium WSBS_2018_MAG_OTU23]
MPPVRTMVSEDSNVEEFMKNPNNGQMSLFLVLDGFEGPIDLLLSLAREQKVDLSKIAILPLAEQFLEFINTASDLDGDFDIDIAADYLVMAAWLAYLKSRLLLPDLAPDDHEEVMDMADALKFQLMRLQAMQNVGKQLMALPRLGQQRFCNGQPTVFAAVENTAFTATLFDLLKTYGHIVSSKEASTLTITASRLYTVEEAVWRLNALIDKSPGWSKLQSFMPAGLATAIDHRSALASHFTASLELVRDGALTLRQDKAFGDIWLSKPQKAQA